METRIVGVLVSDRMKEAEKVQQILTKYGCLIKTRLGMHETSDTTCSKKGLLILELIGDKNEWDKMEAELSSVTGLEVKNMTFSY